MFLLLLQKSVRVFKFCLEDCSSQQMKNVKFLARLLTLLLVLQNCLYNQDKKISETVKEILSHYHFSQQIRSHLPMVH